MRAVSSARGSAAVVETGRQSDQRALAVAQRIQGGGDAGGVGHPPGGYVGPSRADTIGQPGVVRRRCGEPPRRQHRRARRAETGGGEHAEQLHPCGGANPFRRDRHPLGLDARLERQTLVDDVEGAVGVIVAVRPAGE